MNLSGYRKKHLLSQAKFAERMTDAGFPATQALISQWESGQVVVTAERCLQVEQVTDGEVPRNDLRPDLFGEAAPEAPDRRHRRPAAAEGNSAAEADEVAVQPLRKVA